MTEQDVVLVNDWSELKTAVHFLHSVDLTAWEIVPEINEAVETIYDYVPRLLAQYASLLEASFALTDAWEQANQNRTPEGLYLP
jgi:hypothetical protein